MKAKASLCLPLSLIVSALLATPSPVQEADVAPLSPSAAATLFKAPTLITLKAQDAPVSEVFESMMKQANLPYSTQGSARSETVTIDLANVPFWEAELAFEKASGRGLFRGSSGRGDEPKYSLVISRRPIGGLKSGNGPLIAYLQGVTRTKTNIESVVFGEVSAKSRGAEPSSQTNKDELKLNAIAYLDPAVPLVPGSPQFALVEAVDENGQEIFSPGGGARGGDWKLESSFSATPTGAIGRKIARLRIGYSAFVALEPQVLTFENIGDGTPQSKVGPRGDGIENYEVADAKATPAAYVVMLRANRPTDGMDFRYAGDAFFKDVKLVDANGKQWKGNTTSMGDRTGVSNPATVRKYEARVSFGRPGDTFAAPLKLIWTIPTRFQPLETTFEWKDVPLP